MAHPPLVIGMVLALIAVVILMGLGLARRTPKSVKQYREYRDTRQLVVTIEDLTFENRVIATLQAQTGCWGKPNERGLIEVYKRDKLVGIVKCCEDAWDVTPALINEMAKLRVWYHVRVAYIATSGAIPSMAKSEAKYRKIRILRVEHASL